MTIAHGRVTLLSVDGSIDNVTANRGAEVTSKRFGDIVLGMVATGAVAAAVVFVRFESRPKSGRDAQIERRDVGVLPEIAAGGHAIGRMGAPIILVEFSDFQCPFCRQLHQTLHDLQVRLPGSVSITYRHFPLAGHSLAFSAAVASECAAEAERFTEYARLLFERQDSIGILSWEDFAVRAGIRDTVRFARCRGHSQAVASVRRDIAVGLRLGLEGTPAIIVNGQMIVGAVPLDSLEAFVLLASGKRLFRQ